MDVLNNALEQGIIPAIVVAIYLIIVKIIDIKKDNEKDKINTVIMQSVRDIGDFIKDMTKNIIEKNKEKCKIAIRDSMNCAVCALSKFVMNTVINNHIDVNKKTILYNIKNISNAEFYNVFSTLNMYEIDGIRVSEYLKKEWIDEIEQVMIESIYDTSLSNIDKIMSFNNKINIKFQSYITYIINNAIK